MNPRFLILTLLVAVVVLGALVIYQGRQLQTVTAQLQPSTIVTASGGLSVQENRLAPMSLKPTPVIAPSTVEPRTTFGPKENGSIFRGFAFRLGIK